MELREAFRFFFAFALTFFLVFLAEAELLSFSPFLSLPPFRFSALEGLRLEVAEELLEPRELRAIAPSSRAPKGDAQLEPGLSTRANV